MPLMISAMITLNEANNTGQCSLSVQQWCYGRVVRDICANVFLEGALKQNPIDLVNPVPGCLIY